MKIKQLYRTVCLLGFGMTGERIPEESFVASVNLAVGVLSSVIPVVDRRKYTVELSAEKETEVVSLDASDIEGAALCELVTVEHGRSISRALISGGRIYAPIKLRGTGSAELWVNYARAPRVMTLEDMEANSEVDVAKEAEYLLPYLVGAIAWADAEPELAALYREFYEAHVGEIKELARIRNRAYGFSVSYSSPWLSDEYRIGG